MASIERMKQLNISSSAVGKTVVRLEHRLKTRLLNRTTRSLVLTETGTIFYRACLKMLVELERAESQSAQVTNQPLSPLKINVPLAFGRIKVLPLILPFSKQYPDLKPQLYFSDNIVDLMTNRIDLSVRISGGALVSDFENSRYLGVERVIFCASPEYLARYGMPKTKAVLLQHAAIIYGAKAVWRFNDDSHQRLVPAKARMQVDSAEAQVSAVSAGYGIAQMATWLVEKELAYGQLVEVCPEYAIDGLTLKLVWLKRRDKSARLMALIDHLTHTLTIS